MAATPTAAELDVIRLLLARMGITAEQLEATVAPRPVMPTFAEYLEQVSAAVTSSTRRVYGTYWRHIRQAWGPRRLDEPTPLEITQLAAAVKAQAVVRRNTRSGRGAAEHLIAALRCVYRHAVADGLIPAADNPALRVAKPRRLASPRHALSEHRVRDLLDIAGTTGNDPHLDVLLLRLHLETACRRGGALALRRCDLEPDQCLVRLREKSETVRRQPVSPTLMSHLLHHWHDRGTDHPDGQLLRYRTRQPITSRRYDHLWQRLGTHLPWVATRQVSTHWLRHTTLTWVKRHHSYAVARAYAGHTARNDVGSTATYVGADLDEVGQALEDMTGEAHPLVPPAGSVPVA